MTPIQKCSVLGYCLPGDAWWGGSQSIFLTISELLDAHPPQRLLLCDSVGGALGKMQDDRSVLQVSLAGLTFSKILFALTLLKYPRSQIYVSI